MSGGPRQYTGTLRTPAHHCCSTQVGRELMKIRGFLIDQCSPESSNEGLRKRGVVGLWSSDGRLPLSLVWQPWATSGVGRMRSVCPVPYPSRPLTHTAYDSRLVGWIDGYPGNRCVVLPEGFALHVTIWAGKLGFEMFFWNSRALIWDLL